MVEKLINNKLTSSEGFKDLYPFESRFMNINGHDLHYIDKGEGKPVLMVHGNPSWSFYYRHLIKSLSKDFRTIAPDHIGCGFSDKPDTKTYKYTLESRIKDLDTLITRLDINEKINLVLHDWGGMIGLAWAIDHLDRIDKIIITNTSGFFLPKEKRFPLSLWLIKYIRFFAIPAVLGLNVFAYGALYFGSKTRLTPKVKKGLVEPYNSWANRIATLKFVQDIPLGSKDKSYSIVKHVDQNLKHLAPESLLFLWGAKDFVFDLAFFNEFMVRFPNATAHVFHDAGHYLFEDKPRETSRLIEEFLNK
ncbi:MAG: alpha/beta fold hydrolase [Desulfobacula sp.]|jgi:cis-3-alkyl-4-acyloxetan-2-one decarboxylase|uniref:alpha/beta fold hydrolase n=1 Tax=Desulfobacula sp. TaxID=2593537 RepID=UPI001D6BEDBE|nr:alpha/beta fold hydrolase [Desulfobacula sp.]MBT3487126.1 alpha/beta fold hydrolase [Desulfobacula sp.]MBT3806697.1 alpha/beta fold hydrolase [Desulfobacula sp.]MBT4026953.1 alpha/beta fold hydrolase [Desulfobacula sp.]MBT4197989.1 alpha/beta fold hydrolase [Desulfobacula sp.]